MNERIVNLRVTGTDYTSVREASFCFENSDDKDRYSKFKERLLDRFLEERQSISCINTYERMSLYKLSGNGQKYFQGNVGVTSGYVSLPDESDDGASDERVRFRLTLQIRSRFDGEKSYFLSALLLSQKLKLLEHYVPSNEENIYDYMLFSQFKQHFVEAFRKGYFRQYRRFECNSDRLRGSIDISRHLRLNAGQDNGKIAHSYRENSIDNGLNHLIIAAYRHIRSKYPQMVADNFDCEYELKHTIDSLAVEIGYQEKRAGAVISKSLKPISHPYYTEYEQLRVVSLKILRDSGISIFDEAQDEDSQTLFFYIPRLWEDYAAECIRLRLKGCEMKFTPDIYVFGEKDRSGSYKFTKRTDPDYVFYHEGAPFMMLDAKFKPKWSVIAETGELAAKGNDGTEDYDKCLRDMVSINASAAGVVFPTSAGKVCISKDISRYNFGSKFYLFGIPIPSVEDMSYSDWKQAFDECVDDCVKEISQYISCEKERFCRLRTIMDKLRDVISDGEYKELCSRLLPDT